MRQSQLFGGTRKDISAEETSKNAILLQRGGYVNKTLAGVYAYLPLGLMVQKNVIRIVREEMDKLPHTSEVLMAAIQPKELWDESGRWADYEEDMYRLPEAGGGLGPTHEEIATDIFRQYVHSYKEVPVAFYQVQTKFRKEARAKSGLLRGREFVMKDLYSFHETEEDLHRYYNEVKEAYFRVYDRLGLKAVYTEASGGLFSKFSHEFQVVTPVGEDTIYMNDDGTAKNKEVVEGEPEGGLNAVEVGNIFPLNMRFSTPMKAQITREDGSRSDVWMGCYGLGITRVIGTMVEVHAENEGKMVWPEEVAPFKFHIIDLTPEKLGADLYGKMKAKGESVLYDDRDKRAGEMFADADLIGAPIRLTVSKRSLEAGGVERKDMRTGEVDVVVVESL